MFRTTWLRADRPWFTATWNQQGPEQKHSGSEAGRSFLRTSQASISLNYALVWHVYLQGEFANTKGMRMGAMRRSHKYLYFVLKKKCYLEYPSCLDTTLYTRDRQINQCGPTD